ncbi:MAG: 30S ribosomal protein S12 methylthiotransferase RimO [Fretibacterium sp.]|nr:30S ribosomal protein S12 methylthiotransferase RimO [Fretibacterium sp.]
MTMGCAKNSVDSEVLAGRLRAAGHILVDDVREAQVGIVNTCGFIQEAVEENIDVILDLERLKEEGELKKIAVVGCLVNRYEAELREALPSVDLFAHAESWDEVTSFLSPDSKPSFTAGRAPLPETTPWSRYLKVGEGCDTFCSYCAIPIIRGRLRSAPIELLVEEALKLCDEGARELCLVGQDLTAYGRDLYGEPATWRLLEELDRALPNGVWLRLLYLHPDRMTSDFVEFLLESAHILPYLDIPIQHVDDSILARMNRAPAGGHIRALFRRIRELDPLFAIRTTIMTGFPGETEEQFQKVLDFLDEARIDRVGSFVYSPEEGTPAASFPERVPEETAHERRARLMELQEGISLERNGLFVGRELDVLVEEVELDQLLGRSYRDAPEVDGVVTLPRPGGMDFEPGCIVRARITDCDEHDLQGVLL